MKSSKIRVEQLEDRKLLAANITEIGGMTIISGDGQGPQQIVVNQTGDNSVEVVVNGSDPVAVDNVFSLVIVGGAGNDLLQNNTSIRSTMIGGAGDDVLLGGSGYDFMRGGDGDDVLLGRDGRDYLYGEAGDDILYGGDDNRGDVLSDLCGKNRFIAGGGAVEINATIDSIVVADDDDEVNIREKHCESSK